MFPVLSRMAMDVLSVQATSVASESAFSTRALDFEEEILTIEVQDNEVTPLSDEEVTLDVASQGTMASGSRGEEPEFDYDLTHYDIDD
ncbi:zinc finger BED domain-containing protein RICESLEEPER 2-like protein [Tanacetum coccineum]